MDHKVNIAFVDDHKLVREGIISLLLKENPSLNIVFEASNGKDFIEKINSNAEIPKIVMLDLEMTVMNGYETIRWIHENKPELKIIVLTQVIDEYRVKEILKLGIKGYFDKGGCISDMNAAIISVDLGGEYFPGFVKDIQKHTQNGKKDEYLKGSITGIYFSEDEIRLIKLCYMGHYNKEISAILNIGEKSIEGYISKILRKMSVKNRVEMVRYALQNKLIDVSL
jgi:DNA-binding NarL/FixJ family response regulator